MLFVRRVGDALLSSSKFVLRRVVLVRTMQLLAGGYRWGRTLQDKAVHKQKHHP